MNIGMVSTGTEDIVQIIDEETDEVYIIHDLMKAIGEDNFMRFFKNHRDVYVKNVSEKDFVQLLATYFAVNDNQPVITPDDLKERLGALIDKHFYLINRH